jgi:hypothetical protein
LLIERIPDAGVRSLESGPIDPFSSGAGLAGGHHELVPDGARGASLRETHCVAWLKSPWLSATVKEIVSFASNPIAFHRAILFTNISRIWRVSKGPATPVFEPSGSATIQCPGCMELRTSRRSTAESVAEAMYVG